MKRTLFAPAISTVTTGGSRRGLEDAIVGARYRFDLRPLDGMTALSAGIEVVWGPGGHILLFLSTSLPVVEDYRNTADNNRWRVGAGLIFLWS
jgi:hypothetical protein